MLLILAIHFRKIRHVGQEDIDLDDLLDRGVGRGEDGFDVGDAGGCFFGDAALHEGAGGGARDLARDVDLGWGGDGLGLFGERGEGSAVWFGFFWVAGGGGGWWLAGTYVWTGSYGGKVV